MSIVEQLKAKRAFTATEKDIASFILHHAEDVPRMTVGELADAAHVSKAAIIRLCHKLGLEGYRDLRIGLASELERRRTHLSDVDASRPFTPRESCATMLRAIATLERDAIEHSYQAASPEVVSDVAQAIVEAPHVVVFAIGDSCILGQLFGSMLSKLGIHVTSAGLYGDLAPSVSSAGPGDVVLILSYTGRFLGTDAAQHACRALRERGCYVVAITGLDAHDPLLEHVSRVISYPMRESELGSIGGFYSLTCMNYLLNSLYARVYALDFEANDLGKNESETWWRPESLS